MALHCRTHQRAKPSSESGLRGGLVGERVMVTCFCIRECVQERMSDKCGGAELERREGVRVGMKNFSLGFSTESRSGELHCRRRVGDAVASDCSRHHDYGKAGTPMMTSCHPSDGEIENWFW